jgi:chitin synthase
MQFVIFLELIGTVILPSAFVFTLCLIISAIVGNTQVLPLVMLLVALFLPGILVLSTTKHYSYIYWMFIYMLALPIWNFALPLYSFWYINADRRHFDDFTWLLFNFISGELREKLKVRKSKEIIPLEKGGMR